MVWLVMISLGPRIFGFYRVWVDEVGTVKVEPRIKNYMIRDEIRIVAVHD